MAIICDKHKYKKQKNKEMYYLDLNLFYSNMKKYLLTEFSYQFFFILG